MNKNDAEMAALEAMTPTIPVGAEEGSVESPNPTSLGKVDIGRPKYDIDARLQQLRHIEVNRDIMLYRSMFYPTDWKFKCRAAFGAEVANFSTIDNEDPLSVHDGINDLLKNCLRIETGNGATVSYRKLYEFDRLWFVLFIRDLTMMNPETRLNYEASCEHCSEKNVVTLSHDTLVETPLSDLAKKYFDEHERAFIVRTKSYGDIKIQPSNLHRAELLREWMQSEMQKKNTPDKSFIKLYWLLVNEDNDTFVDSVERARVKFIELSNSDPKKVAVYLKLASELQVGLSQEVKFICEQCGREAHTDIRFPDGISNLLLPADISEELL